MNAEKAPSERQSRFVLGLVKLNANMINTRELSITKGQRPYAGALSWFMTGPLQALIQPTCLMGRSHFRRGVHVRDGTGA